LDCTLRISEQVDEGDGCPIGITTSIEHASQSSFSKSLGMAVVDYTFANRQAFLLVRSSEWYDPAIALFGEVWAKIKGWLSEPGTCSFQGEQTERLQ